MGLELAYGVYCYNIIAFFGKLEFKIKKDKKTENDEPFIVFII